MQCCAQQAEAPASGDHPAPTASDIPKTLQSALEHHKALQSALEHHHAGRLSQAKAIYQQILQAKPNHHKALHLLGVIANQEGEYDRAVELINRAIQASPSKPGYHYNLGCVYNALNKPDEAIACYRKALAIRPDYADALNNLGNTLKDQGKVDEAIVCYRKALAIKPDDVTTLNNLGIALKSQGKLDEAIACYRKALAIKPDYAEAYNNLGAAFTEQGKSYEAIACYQKALVIRPVIKGQPLMAQFHIHQIYYSEQTQHELDPGFIPLNNLANERPDWREYWPIRNYLLNNKLAEDDYYGFFSPKFGQKTNLSAEQVKDFINTCDDGTDVVIFSPWWDLQSFFSNLFEQGESAHPGFYNVAQTSLSEIGETIDLTTLLMDSRNSIFCNFFVAKPKFWKVWLDLNEKLFMVAEGRGSSNAKRLLNSDALYGNGKVHFKVFVMERIASYILATQSQWRTRTYNPYSLFGYTPQLHDFLLECLLCDALKIAYSTSGFAQYKAVYFHVRQKIIKALNEQKHTHPTLTRK